MRRGFRFVGDSYIILFPLFCFLWFLYHQVSCGSDWIYLYLRLFEQGWGFQIDLILGVQIDSFGVINNLALKSAHIDAIYCLNYIISFPLLLFF